MKIRSLTHVGDDQLLRDGNAAVARERGGTADALTYIAEIDARKLWAREACESMKEYCVKRMRLEEGAAFKYIRAARLSREFPAILDGIDEGRLHLSGVGELAPYLTPANADELLAAAANRSKLEIRQLLAERFPRSEMMALVQTPPAAAPGPAVTDPPRVLAEAANVTAGSRSLAPARVDSRATAGSVEPMAPGRFALQVMIDRGTHEDIEYARALLGHQVPDGDLSEVHARAFRALVRELEKQRFAATSRGRAGRGSSSLRPRHIPASVKSAVWERDGGQCTFTSDSGHRCQSRKRLEFDHVEPVARGGAGTVENLRLVCRAHNQYLAERAFGEGFMEEKREAARGARARASATTRAAAEPAAESTIGANGASAPGVPNDEHDVIPWLRRLGYRAGEAQRAAEYVAAHPADTLEGRIRAALAYLAPPHRTVPAPRRPAA